MVVAKRNTDISDKRLRSYYWILAICAGMAFAAAFNKIHDCMKMFGTAYGNYTWGLIGVSFVLGCICLFLIFNLKRYFHWCDTLYNKLNK